VRCCVFWKKFHKREPSEENKRINTNLLATFFLKKISLHPKFS